MKKNKIILALSLATTFAISGCSEGDADDYVQRNLFAVGDIVEAVEDGGTVEGDVSLNDKGEGLTFSLESGSQMQNGTLEFNQDGTFNYTPNPDFNGTDSVTYIATQSGTGETDHATLTIKVINDFETLAEYGWQLSSEQSFDGETIDSEQWTASNANISDGQLILTAPVQSNAMAKSASIIRIDANTVGRIEAAVQIPEGKDVYSAFSLLPMADKYQGLNSIVMLEGNSGGLISGSHYGTGLTTGIHFNEDSVNASYEDFHTYAVEWGPRQIRWYIDGFHVHTADKLNLWGYTLSGQEPVINNNGPFDQDLNVNFELTNHSTETEAQLLIDYVKVWTCDTSVASDIEYCASAEKTSISKEASDRIEELGAVEVEIFADGVKNSGGQVVTNLAPLAWHSTDEELEVSISNWNGPTIEVMKDAGEHDLVIDVSHPEGDANIGLSVSPIELIGLNTAISFDMYIDSENTNTETFDIRMETGWPYMGMMTWQTADLVKDEWVTYTITLDEFINSPFLAPGWLTWIPGVVEGDPLPLNPKQVANLLVIEFHGGVHFKLDNIKLTCVSNESCVQAPMLVQQPAEYVPSTIYEAENWQDVGGEVVVEDSDVASGGQNVGWIDAGEYLQYTVSAPVEGNYQIDYRVASGTGSEGFTMSLNGNVVDTQLVENTGGWQEWATLSSPEFPLTVGQHTVRVDFLGGGINLDYLKLNSPLFEIFLEAESFDFVGAGVDVATEETTDENGGLNVGWIDAGDYLEYPVNIPVDGRYKITYRVASQGGSDGFDVSLGGVSIHTQAVEDTGGWQEWTSITEEVELVAGEQTLRIDFIGGSVNVNWIKITN